MTEHTDGVAANGAPTLTDRVKELRLAGKMEAPKVAGATNWLPWLRHSTFWGRTVLRSVPIS